MAASIKRERPDQRRHHRVTAPLFVTIGEETVRAADWSIGGLRVTDFPGKLPGMGDELELYLTLPFQGFDVAFEAVGEVVRRDADGHMFAVQFAELGERETDLLRHFIEELVRGNMSAVEDTIQRFDVPVTPVSLQPDVNPKNFVPPTRWPMRTVMYTAFYFLLGIIIFGYAGMLIYANFVRMEVRSAVISAPIEAIEAHVDGHITWTNYRPGDQVRAGTVILNVIDNKLERELEFARIAIEERHAQVGFLQKRLAEEVIRLGELAAVETKNIAQLKLDVEALQAKLRVAKATYRRIRALHARGYATDVRLEETEKETITLGSALKRKQLELASSTAIAGRNLGKRYITDERAIGDVERLKAQVQLARTDTEFAGKKLKALLKHRARLAVRAPFDGIIVKFPHANRSTIKRGDVIAIVEQHRLRHIVAFLNQDEIMRVGLGDLAPIYVPALDQTLEARVTSIDRTAGFIEEQTRARKSGNRWQRDASRSARVTLDFEKPDLVRGDAQYSSGLPVVVIFKQRSSSHLLSTIKRRGASLIARSSTSAGKRIAGTKDGKTPTVRRTAPPASSQRVGKAVRPVTLPVAGERGT